MIKFPPIRPMSYLWLFAIMVILIASVRDGAAQSCDTVTDAQIVAEVYSRIKADKGLASQVGHINVVSINRAVKLQGWADTLRDYEKVVDIVHETRCVRLVNVNLFEPQPPPPGGLMRGGASCSTGLKRCGDICIPDGDVCSIMAESGN